MSDFFVTYHHLFNVFLIGSGYGLSQWIVMRAGVFSVATAGLASLGAYTAAILTTKLGWPYPLSLLAGTLMGTLGGFLLAVPLARLRGVFQAIATLAFVQVVVAIGLYADSLTGGAVGLNAIPTLVGTKETLLALVVVVYLMSAVNATRLGRAFEAIRQDEAVASSLGVSVTFHQALAFALSGAIAGLFGGLEAFQTYTLFPNTFGFPLIIAALSYVVLGGRRSVTGPIIGTAILLILPEISRPLADYRNALYGLILMLVIAYMPRGIYDTAVLYLRRRRLAASSSQEARQ
ncbi:MAG: branched-chain amino acid ABC transporter permease [Betaproteobacteria bacterium]|nr:branched-chain amino acid ABC transporter permease [Betaproteobacteria bacterium]